MRRYQQSKQQWLRLRSNASGGSGRQQWAAAAAGVAGVQLTMQLRRGVLVTACRRPQQAGGAAARV